MFPGMSLDVDEATGVKAYAYEDGDRSYVVGVFVQRTASLEDLSARLLKAAESGIFSFADEMHFVSERSRDVLNDPTFRRGLIEEVRDTYGIGPHVFEAKAVPFRAGDWKRLRVASGVPRAYGTLERDAVRRGDVGRVSYAILPAGIENARFVRGNRETSDVPTTKLEFFLDLLVGNEMIRSVRDPVRTSGPMGYGESRMLERKVAERLAESN